MSGDGRKSHAFANLYRDIFWSKFHCTQCIFYPQPISILVRNQNLSLYYGQYFFFLLALIFAWTHRWNFNQLTFGLYDFVYQLLFFITQIAQQIVLFFFCTGQLFNWSFVISNKKQSLINNWWPSWFVIQKYTKPLSFASSQFLHFYLFISFFFSAWTFNQNFFNDAWHTVDE